MITPEERQRMESYPAFQPVDQQANIAAKQRILAIMRDILAAPGTELDAAIHAGYHADASVNVTHPINELHDLHAVDADYWRPLRAALPDVERRDDIVAGGIYFDTHWIGCSGHYVGTFVHDWLDIPATNGAVAVRFAEGHELRDGKIITSYVFIDFLDLMRQVGYWPIAPSLGREMHWLAPMMHDGVIMTPQDATVSEQSNDLIRRMHTGLGVYHGQPLTREVMDMIEAEDARHFHRDFMWYGAAGIGTTRGVKAFNDYHGYPFLLAFPDRGSRDTRHFIRIADGRYAVTGGWGYLQATHTGGDLFGVGATGRHIEMRVMDFYRCDDQSIRENWVPMDIPHMLFQMGVDVFGRMRHQFRQTNRLDGTSWLQRTY